MGLTHLAIVLNVGLIQLPLSFVPLDATVQPSDNPTKGHLQNVSLQQLTSRYLQQLYSADVTYLKISHSSIEAIDKYAFDHLTHLNLLEISDSEIQHEIDPQIFSRLPGLEILVLKNVGLRNIKLNLTHVQEVILSKNEIETVNGSSIDGQNVNFLDLSNNKLTFLAGTFANMSKLSMIDVSRNKIREIKPVFQENVNLLRILASENKISSTEGLNLPWLKTLDLFSNKIETLDSESFPKMAALEELVLAFNEIKHVGDAFKDLIELKYLNLAWNEIEELRPDLFRKNLYLKKLSLQGNKIKILNKFQSVHPHLTHLDISHNQLALLDDGFFHSIPSLQTLDLSFNHLKALTDLLAPLSELRILNLAYNDVVMTGYELSANHQLTRVNLSSNDLRGGLTHFKNNRQLREVDLSGNEIVHFCDGNVPLVKNLLKLNLKGNRIQNLNCLEDFKSLCEVDLRENPLSCGKDLDGLLLNLAKRKGAPYKLSPEFRADLLNQCENLSLNESFGLWNSIKRELCPEEEYIELEEAREWESFEDESTKEPAAESIETKERRPTGQKEGPDQKENNKKHFVVLPIRWINRDEINKPNPLQNPQSERTSWEEIEEEKEHSELLKGFEEEKTERRPRFSWYTIALILIGLSLTLTCFNLVVFLYIKMKVWRKNDTICPQKYTILHNEVYKNTTEPSKDSPGTDAEWVIENQTKNKIFTNGKINEILLNFGLNKKDKDSESAKNVLINAPTV